MIDAITGRVMRVGNDHLVVETGGIAYRIFCPTRDLADSQRGEETTVYVHLVVRDDAISLFGFRTLEEREVFRSLLPVGQVGPRLALQILSTLPVEVLIAAIDGGDIERLTTVKGIGRKTAQRILIELRGKISPELLGVAGPHLLSPLEETALRALTSKSLGFSAGEARRAIERLRREDLPLEELVRRALEVIGT